MTLAELKELAAQEKLVIFKRLWRERARRIYKWNKEGTEVTSKTVPYKQYLYGARMPDMDDENCFYKITKSDFDWFRERDVPVIEWKV